MACGIPSVDLDDVVQDVFGAAVLYCDTFDPSRGTLKVWLRGIARNEAARHFKGKTEVACDVPEPASDETPERKAFELELERALAEIIRTLDHDHREVLFLRFVEGLSSAEIAARLNVHEGTVRTRLHRALERCREAFRAKGINDPPGALLVPVLAQDSSVAGGSSETSRAGTLPSPRALLRSAFLASAWFGAGVVAAWCFLHPGAARLWDASAHVMVAACMVPRPASSPSQPAPLPQLAPQAARQPRPRQVDDTASAGRDLQHGGNPRSREFGKGPTGSTPSY